MSSSPSAQSCFIIQVSSSIVSAGRKTLASVFLSSIAPGVIGVRKPPPHNKDGVTLRGEYVENVERFT